MTSSCKESKKAGQSQFQSQVILLCSSLINETHSLQKVAEKQTKKEHDPVAIY